VKAVDDLKTNWEFVVSREPAKAYRTFVHYSEDMEMSAENLITALYIFALAAFLGYQVISRVPPLLHTPLMSATNAISGISLVGSLVTAGARYNTISTILGFIAVFCSTTNVVGGFVITDRMLKMFKRKPTAKEEIKK
jgi:NAD(P) transhydrogenase subunit alpha